MKLGTVANLDALSLLERIDNSAATLIYFDPPTEVDDEATAALRQHQSLSLHGSLQSRRILKDDGVIVWHTLPKLSSHVRLSLDRVFGSERFVKEIVLKYGKRHTVLIMYSKTGTFYYRPPSRPTSEHTPSRYLQSDSKGSYKLEDLTRSVDQPNRQFSWHGRIPRPGHSWLYTSERLDELYSDGCIHLSETTFPRKKVYPSEPKLGTVWDDIGLPINSSAHLGIPGQQSLALMRRVGTMVTQVDDVIVDPFCGTGMTVIAAEQLGRKWIAGDISLVACNQAIREILRQTGRTGVLLAEDAALDIPVRATTAELVRTVLPSAPSTATDTYELLGSQESKILEFKQTLSMDVKSNKKEKYIELMSLKTIAAFLNSDGGVLLVGVNDNREPLGLEEEINRFYEGSSDKFLLHFANLIRSHIGTEFYPLLSQHLILIDTKRILRVDCGRSERPCFVDDDFYVRTNPATDKLAGATMLEYVSTRFPNRRA